MPAKDIVKLYKEAKHKKKQINILTELNLCTRQDIISVLKDNGISREELKKVMDANRRNKKKQKRNSCLMAFCML